MKVAIIGSGNVGKALAGSATRAGHTVTLAAHDPQHAEDAAKATKAHAARSNKEAVKDAELVVLAVPADKVDEVVGALSSDLDGKVIIDVTNRVNAQDPGQVLDGSSMAEQIQKKAPKGIRTAQVDVDLIARRLKAAQQDYEARYATPKDRHR